MDEHGRAGMREAYPAKVLLAWGEAISGNTGLRDWLMKNGYPELGLFTFALYHKQEARQWLLENGHPQLMALIRGVEGDHTALLWLAKSGYSILRDVAMAGDGDEEAFRKLVAEGHKELAVIAKKIHKVKTDLDDDYRDPHKYPQA